VYVRPSGWVPRPREVLVRGQLRSIARKSAASFFICLSLAIGINLVLPSTARAEMPSCAWWQHKLDIKDVPVYNGNLCGNAKRDGLVVNELKYSWTSYYDTCNWWVDFDFYTAANKDQPYFHDQGNLQPTCDASGHGTRTGGLPIYAQVGIMCTSIYSDATRLVRTCQQIN
jgi:hypothetical protein